MSATSPSRSGAPFCQVTMRLRYSSTDRIWSFASSMVKR
jgi:hypothetical protein